MCVSHAEPRVVVESTAPVTLDTVEDYAALSGDCIVQVPEVRLGTTYDFSKASCKVLLPLQSSPTVHAQHGTVFAGPIYF